MAKLTVLIGCPACGKSTYAKEHPEMVWISRDEIRNEIVGLDKAEQEGRTVSYFSKEDTVYNIFIKAIQKNLSEGKDVIADATHIDNKARTKLFRMLDTKGKLYDEAIAIVFLTRPEVCIERNRRRNGWRRVPDHVIKDMYNKMIKDIQTIPTYFDKVITSKGAVIYDK